MPKLNTDVLIQRLQGRIAELEAGEEVANKHIRALLTDAQQQTLDDALAEQVELKKEKRARTEEEKKALGWKTIREVRLEVLKNALAEANAGLLADYKRRMKAADVRQGRIYFDAYGKARDEGKDVDAAKAWANNELTRAGLRRMDGMRVAHQSRRDREVNEMEDAIRARIKSEMTPEELEQQQMLEDLERARKLGKRSGTDLGKK
jgi:hypothetical protein